jgi:hypothetical protein
MDEYDNNDYGTEIDEYNDQDATDVANGDYNTWEENELARENEADSDYPEVDDGAMTDQLMDQEMEDRIGGTGYLECE